MTFSRISWQPERPPRAGRTFDVRDYGARVDGRTDDTAALIAACDACAKGGGGTVIIPGDMRVGSTEWSPTLPPVAIVAFDRVDSVAVVATGEIRVDREFSDGDRVDLFGFTDCRNPQVHARVVASSPAMDGRGIVVMRCRGGCRDVVANVQATNCAAALICTALADADDARRAIGVRFDIGVTNSAYGAVFQFSGDDASGEIVADGAMRSYFVYGARRHAVSVVSRNNRADDCLIRGYLGRATEDISLTYVNRGSTRAATAAPGVAIAPNVVSGNPVPAIIRNITVDITVEYTGTGGPGHAFTVYRTKDDVVLDTTDRGHRLENIEIAITSVGGNEGNSANPILALYDGGAGWGPGEHVANWHIRRLRCIRPASSALILLTSLEGYATIRDVTTEGEANITAGPAGRIVCVDCRAAALATSSADRSYIDYIRCELSSTGRLSLANKLYAACTLEGKPFDRTPSPEAGDVGRRVVSRRVAHPTGPLRPRATEEFAVAVPGVSPVRELMTLVALDPPVPQLAAFAKVASAGQVSVRLANISSSATIDAESRLLIDVISS